MRFMCLDCGADLSTQLATKAFQNTILQSRVFFLSMMNQPILFT